MVQSRQGLRLRQSVEDPDSDIFVHMETVRLAGINDLQPGDRWMRGLRRAKGPDRRRASPRLNWRALGLALLVPIAACQPSPSTTVSLERSAAGLEQVPLTITTAKAKRTDSRSRSQAPRTSRPRA
jgi:hypothetical protein